MVKNGSLRFGKVLELRITRLNSSNDTAFICAAVGSLGAEGFLGGLGASGAELLLRGLEGLGGGGGLGT